MKKFTTIIAILAIIVVTVSCFAACGENVEQTPTEAPASKAPVATTAPTEVPDPRINVVLGKVGVATGFKSFTNPENFTDGDFIYDMSVESYSDMCVGDKYCDVKGDEAAYDETHIYRGRLIIDLQGSYKVSGFNLFCEGVKAQAQTPFYGINAFDLLVSDDGENWTVAYTIDEILDAWEEYEDEDNLSTKGYYMTHYFKDDFTEVGAKYVMFAVVEARPAGTGEKAAD